MLKIGKNIQKLALIFLLKLSASTQLAAFSSDYANLNDFLNDQKENELYFQQKELDDKLIEAPNKACVGWFCSDNQREESAPVQNLISSLVSQGANIEARDSYGYTPLMIAAYHGVPTTLKTLINFGANKEVQLGNTPLLKLLLAHDTLWTIKSSIRILVESDANLDDLTLAELQKLRKIMSEN